MRDFFQRRGRAVSYLVLADYGTLVASFIWALYMRRYDPGRNLIIVRSARVAPEILFLMGYALFLLPVFGALGLYMRKVWLSGLWHAAGILKAAGAAVGGYFLLRGATKSLHLVPSRYVILVWGATLLAGLLVHRLAVFPFLVRLASRRGLQRRVVLIGSGRAARDFYGRWKARAGSSTFQIVGYLEDRGGRSVPMEAPRLGDLAALPELVRPHRLEGAVLADPAVSHDELLLLMDECIRRFGWVDVHSEKAAVWHAGRRADYHFAIPFIRMAGVSRNPFYRAFKRGFDAAASALALFVLSPLLLLLMLLVRASSPGPVFYARPRIGRNGRPFPFYKFRSMRVGADRDTARRDAILAYMEHPDRVAGKFVNPAQLTPIGAFLRKWALDELPQLWNVLRGDMALVGPRPLPPEEYEAQAEWHKRRFDIKPGCTGLWKVSAARSGISFTDTVLYDIYYARNMNPLLDLSILLQTLRVIFSGRADA